jgi:hypothetical protein
MMPDFQPAPTKQQVRGQLREASEAAPTVARVHFAKGAPLELRHSRGGIAPPPHNELTAWPYGNPQAYRCVLLPATGTPVMWPESWGLGLASYIHGVPSAQKLRRLMRGGVLLGYFPSDEYLFWAIHDIYHLNDTRLMHSTSADEYTLDVELGKLLHYTVNTTRAIDAVEYETLEWGLQWFKPDIRWASSVNDAFELIECEPQPMVSEYFLPRWASPKARPKLTKVEVFSAE